MAWVPIVAAVAGQLISSSMSSDTPTTGQVNAMSPEQRQKLNQLFAAMGKPTSENLGFDQYSGSDRAVLDQLSSTSLAGLEQYAMDLVSGTGQQGEARKFLADQLKPDLTGELYTKGVEEPTLKTFQDRLLPEVTARFGGSAAYGSDRRQQERLLTEDTTKTLEAGRANFLNTALGRGVTSAQSLMTQGPADVASLGAILQARPFSYEEWLRANDTRLKALLAGTGQNAVDAYAVPPKDYSDTGFLLGAALGKYLQGMGGSSGGGGGGGNVSYGG